MPDTKPKEGEVVNNDPNNPGVLTEAFQAQMLQIFGDGGNTYKPTERQVDKMLALEEKGMDYTHQERTQVSPQQKMEFGLFGMVTVALIVIIGLVAWKAPSQLPLTLTGAIAFLTGGAGGYGLGKSKKDE